LKLFYIKTIEISRCQYCISRIESRSNRDISIWLWALNRWMERFL